MNTIDMLIQSNKYKTKQQIFDDLVQVIWDFEIDLKKIMLKNGNYINYYWIDFFSDAILKNKSKLQKMKNPLTVKFWSDKTGIKEAFQIILSMQRGEIRNAMDTKRAGSPLINEIKKFEEAEFIHRRQTTMDLEDSELAALENQMDLKKMDRKTIKNGLVKVWKHAIFDLDFDQTDMEDLCSKFGFNINEVLCHSELYVMPMSIDETNSQAYWVF